MRLKQIEKEMMLLIFFAMKRTYWLIFMTNQVKGQ